MDVEFEEVEELVGYEVDGAIHVFLDAEVEFEGTPGFVAYGEWNVLKLARGICDLRILLDLEDGRRKVSCGLCHTCSPVSLDRVLARFVAL